MTTFYIGPEWNYETALLFDEIRVTVGTARYTANYTPSTTAFEHGAPPTLVEGTLDGTLSAVTAALTDDSIIIVLPLVDASMRDDSIAATLSAPMIVSSVFDNKIGTVTASLTAATSSITMHRGAEVDGAVPFVQTQLDAVVGTVGNMDCALPVLSVDTVGGTYGIDTTLPALSCTLEGYSGILAQLDAVLPAIGVTSLAGATLMAMIDTGLPAVRVDAAGYAAVVGVLDTSLRAPAVSINALLGTSATLDAAITSITAQLMLAGTVYAQLTVTLPSVTSVFTATIPLSQVAVYVTNTITNAVTTYEQFPYNSFAEIDGKYYAAGPSGLVELVGDKDITADVNAVLALGKLHFGSEMQKRMSDFFIAMRSDGDITLRVSVDEQDPYEYTLSPLDIETLKQRRDLIGKGLKGKYWQFEFANTAGCDFDFDSLNAAAVVLSRRL